MAHNQHREVVASWTQGWKRVQEGVKMTKKLSLSKQDQVRPINDANPTRRKRRPEFSQQDKSKNS